MSHERPILVTGTNRSGSTWVGKMIAKSPSVGYIHEPFTTKEFQRPGRCSARFDYWFTYVSRENEHLYYDHIKDTIGFKYKWIDEIAELKSARDALRLLRDYVYFSFCRHAIIRPLVKDPIALFSAEWLASRFNMDVVVLIRHPAAFAWSLKRRNWAHPFSHFLAQPLLIRDHLYPFEEDIRELAEEEHDIVDQAILFWRLAHYMIIKYQKNHPDWVFVRHEDLSRDPLLGFQSIFDKLNLEYSDRIRRIVEEYSSPKDHTEALEGSGFTRRRGLRRDSRANIWAWKGKLSASEIERIRNGVEDISSAFYADEDW